MTVDVGVCSLGAPKLHPHAGRNDAVSFHVQDPGEGDSAKGLFTGQGRGSCGRSSSGRPRSADARAHRRESRS